MNGRLDLDVHVPAREIIRACRSRGLVVQPTVKPRWDGGWARALARRLADPRP
jgi:hypothetical protein